MLKRFLLACLVVLAGCGSSPQKPKDDPKADQEAASIYAALFTEKAGNVSVPRRLTKDCSNRITMTRKSVSAYGVRKLFALDFSSSPGGEGIIKIEIAKNFPNYRISASSVLPESAIKDTKERSDGGGIAWLLKRPVQSVVVCAIKIPGSNDS
jgi:hypothetical protein